MTATQQTIWLQYLGNVPAIPSEEVRVGMLLSWNYSYQESVVIKIEKVSKCFFAMTERVLKDGKEYTRRVKVGRLVAAEMPKA